MAPREENESFSTARLAEHVLLHAVARDPATVRILLEHDAERTRETLKRLIIVYNYVYDHDGNPLWAWRAYRTARAIGEPIPSWVLDYFDQSAQALCDFAEPGCEEPKSVTSNDIAQALGIKKGKGSHLLTKSAASLDWLFSGFIVGLRIDRGDKEDMAIESVAKKIGDSYSKTRADWKRYAAIFPSDPAVLRSREFRKSGEPRE